MTRSQLSDPAYDLSQVPQSAQGDGPWRERLELVHQGRWALEAVQRCLSRPLLQERGPALARLETYERALGEVRQQHPTISSDAHTR